MNDRFTRRVRSRPIMAYLVSKYARNDSLYPKDPKQRATVDQMMFFDAGRLYQYIVKCFVRVDSHSETFFFYHLYYYCRGTIFSSGYIYMYIW